MAGRKVINEQDARRCLAAVNTSGGRLAAWTQAHGVDGRSLNLWRLNLERRGTARAPGMTPRVVELIPASRPDRARVPFRLHVGGVELEVPDEFDERALRRVVEVLKSC